jgi:N-acetylmuramic acid 6-phosphate etherase
VRRASIQTPVLSDNRRLKGQHRCLGSPGPAEQNGLQVAVQKVEHILERSRRMSKHRALEQLTTEQRHPDSMTIDTLPTIDIVQLMNQEDQRVCNAVEMEKDAIARTIERVADSLRQGGRLIYLGAGTSGRLGVLDASECPPTFSTPPDWIVGIIAGGDRALRSAVEGAEDDANGARLPLQELNCGNLDVVIGIASSGRTPFVLGGLQWARQQGATTVGITCNSMSPLEDCADWVIAPVVGPEIISGSTRLKAGTATKMVLNMITTGAMIRLGKTYGNLMVDLTATNEKLKQRSKLLVKTITGLDDAEAEGVLRQCDGEVKTAVVATHHQLSPDEARELLGRCRGQLRQALDGAAGGHHGNG